MFKKLKDKIAEEVKSSPSRIQQLAQVAQVSGIGNINIVIIYMLENTTHGFFLRLTCNPAEYFSLLLTLCTFAWLCHSVTPNANTNKNAIRSN